MDCKEDSKQNGHENQCQIIMRLLDDLVLFKTEDRSPYMKLVINGRTQVWQVEGEYTYQIIQDRFYRKYKNLPDMKNIEKVVKLLAYQAKEGSVEKVFYRVARTSGKIVIDLGTENYQFVEIDGNGWRVVDQTSVNFERSKTMRAMPIPEKGGVIGELRKFVNMGSTEDFILLISFILGAMFHGKQYPIAILQGPQGSAKSTTSEILKEIIDPGAPSLRTLPSKEEDVFIAAKNAHVICYDNLSGISARISDCICKISTGCGISGRKLYTNYDEYVIELSRPIIINGIDDLTARPDLADRAVVFNLPRLDEENRMPASKIWEDFFKYLPSLLGCIFDGLASALKYRDQVDLKVKPRMVDFCMIACAGHRAYGINSEKVLGAFMDNRREIASDTVDSNSIGILIRKFMKDRNTWSGTASELLYQLKTTQLESYSEQPPWTKSASFLAKELNRLSQAFRLSGIEIDSTRTSHKRVLTIRKAPVLPSLLSLPSQIPLKSLKNDSDDGNDSVFEKKGSHYA